MNEADTKRALRQTRAHLRDLSQTVVRFLAFLDAEMKRPSTEEKGRRIAQAANALDMQNQISVRFGLGAGSRKP